MAARGSNRPKSNRGSRKPPAHPAQDVGREPLNVRALPGVPAERMNAGRRKPGVTVDPDTADTTVTSVVLDFEHPLSKETHEAVRTRMAHNQRLNEDLEYRLSGLTSDVLAARMRQRQKERGAQGEAPRRGIDEEEVLREAIESLFSGLAPKIAGDVRRAYQRIASLRLSYRRTSKGIEKLIVAAFILGALVTEAEALGEQTAWPIVKSARGSRRGSKKASRSRGKQIAEEAQTNDTRIAQLWRVFGDSDDDLKDRYRTPVRFISERLGLKQRTVRRRLKAIGP
jgi:hypothetical protein